MYNDIKKQIAAVFPIIWHFKERSCGINPQVCREAVPMGHEKTTRTS